MAGISLVSHALVYGCVLARPRAQVEWRGEMVEVSWKPRAFLLKNFLTDEETAHLIGKVRAHWQLGTVAHACCRFQACAACHEQCFFTE